MTLANPLGPVWESLGLDRQRAVINLLCNVTLCGVGPDGMSRLDAVDLLVDRKLSDLDDLRQKVGSYVARSYATDLARRSSALLRKHGLDRKDRMLRIADTRTEPIPPHLAVTEPSLF